MKKTVVYDKAKWHYEGEYPSDLDESHAYIHTGFFLGWLLDHNMLDTEFLKDIDTESDEIVRFRTRDLTAPKLFELWDGVLADDMLNEEANAFAQSYFDFETGQYLSDYETLLLQELPTLYHVEDTWENYNTMKSQIDRRFYEWKNQQSKK